MDYSTRLQNIKNSNIFRININVPLRQIKIYKIENNLNYTRKWFSESVVGKYGFVHCLDTHNCLDTQHMEYSLIQTCIIHVTRMLFGGKSVQ